MKCVVVVGDGMADEPIGRARRQDAARGGAHAEPRPHGVARHPRPDAHPAGRRAVRRRALGEPGDPGLRPGRATARGCASFEAAGRGVALGPSDVAFRLNLVTLERREDGALVMADFAGGRPTDRGGAASSSRTLGARGRRATASSVHAGRRLPPPARLARRRAGHSHHAAACARGDSRWRRRCRADRARTACAR